MDAVITYCNIDPQWVADKERWSRSSPTSLNQDSDTPHRFESVIDDVIYAVRSIRRHARFFRRIYLVCNSSPPSSVLARMPGVTVVLHSEIFADQRDLPTFNSNAIENTLHRIPGITETFVVFNDDFFVVSPLNVTDFVRDGRVQIYLEDALSPEGRPHPDEEAFFSMWKHCNMLLNSRHGAKRRRFLEHAPYVTRVSTIERLWKVFPDEMEGTSANRFRGMHDVNAVCALAPYFELESGTADARFGRVLMTTISNKVDAVAREWRLLQTRRPLFLCIQRGYEDITPRTAERWRALMEHLLPDPGPHCPSHGRILIVLIVAVALSYCMPS